MLYYIFYFIFSSFCSDFTSFYPLLLHFCMKCFKLVDLFVFSWWTFFAIGLKFCWKIFLGSHPGINFGAIYYPSLPFTILMSDFHIFIYCLLSICYNSKTFILSLRRIQKLPPEKFQKSDLLLPGGLTLLEDTPHQTLHITPNHPISSYFHYLFPFPFPPSSRTLISISVIAFAIHHDFKQEFKIKLRGYACRISLLL